MAMGPMQTITPFDGVTVDDLEKLLGASGQFMRQEMRDELLSRIAESKQRHGSNYHLRAAGDVMKANRYAEDWSRRPAETYDVAGWCREFKENSDAVNEVLQYLQAQMGMNLFSHNPRAMRVFQHIIKSGIEATIFNRTEVRLGETL